MQPIIGISAGRDRSDTNLQKICLIEKYSTAIIQSGAIPLIIPAGIPKSAVNEILNQVNGIMITGGGDIETNRFNGQDHTRVYGVDTDRDDLEIGLVQAADKFKKPLFGICRGIQIINVAFGGNLFTDIQDQKPDALRHDWFPDFPRDLLSHEVEFNPGSLLERITELKNMEVNSLHHQAIMNIADDLVAIAHSPDGLVEAVEKIDHPFFLGVQWHPEWLFSLESTKKIFTAFVNSTKI
ncbi:MAG: gamma-glutamyl-gamma-aminobutyrate hydrolase family protein [Anaerolineaceae bacterium]|nr:gamma-glutamyl-gamma-aminobutyrate hydrolase family protein [Anaerolineaceae bacterium]